MGSLGVRGSRCPRKGLLEESKRYEYRENETGSPEGRRSGGNRKRDRRRCDSSTGDRAERTRPQRGDDERHKADGTLFRDVPLQQANQICTAHGQNETLKGGNRQETPHASQSKEQAEHTGSEPLLMKTESLAP